MLTITDDMGRRVALEGNWKGRLVGTDFGNGGQILAWVSPADSDAYVKLVEEPPELDRVEAIAAIAAGRQDVLPPPKGN